MNLVKVISTSRSSQAIGKTLSDTQLQAFANFEY